ncbi:MAG: lipocalin family protein [Bacteroidetes bacterium]|nr:lipocalin family protein [Bacteroidota bacterium]
MKKFLAIIAFACLAVSCGTPKTVIQSKKVMKGYWTLTNITYSEAGTFNVQLLNDTSRECFEGSTWRFIPNNNSGLYTINDSNCPTGDRNFIFTVQEMDGDSGLYDFLLKPTTKLGKADKGSSTGFRLRLAQLSESSMQWTQTVQVDGKPFTISMNFSKNEE